MRVAIAIFLLTVAGARAQFFLPAEVQWLDFRYVNTNELAGILQANTNITADATTITNNGSGQFSVAHYSSNTFARLAYRMNTRLSWNDFEPGHINDTDFSEAEPGAPLEFDWSDLE